MLMGAGAGAGPFKAIVPVICPSLPVGVYFGPAATPLSFELSSPSSSSLLLQAANTNESRATANSSATIRRTRAKDILFSPEGNIFSLIMPQKDQGEKPPTP